MRLALLITMIGVTVAHADDAKPPAGATRITIDYTYTSFRSNELHYRLETNPRAKQLFGEAIAVSEPGLMCSLSSSADCRDTIAQATFTWDGVEARVELPCTKGVIEIPAPTAAQLTELRTFLDSKVARTLVRMAGKHPPRVWSHGSWMMEAMIDDGPMITFKPGTKMINIRSVGDKGPSAVAFLKELGIDAKRVTKKQGDAFFETEANVDFDGHLVK